MKKINFSFSFVHHVIICSKQVTDLNTNAKMMKVLKENTEEHHYYLRKARTYCLVVKNMKSETFLFYSQIPLNKGKDKSLAEYIHNSYF